MKNSKFVKKSLFHHPVETVFQWHKRTGALQRLTPPWENVTVTRQSDDLREGSMTSFRMKIGPFMVNWEAFHEEYIENRQFVDRQIRGPFALWKHTHRFIPEDEGSSWLEDTIEYRLPFRFISDLLAGKKVMKKIEIMFDYRHSILAADLALPAGGEKKKIVITGASGLIGRALVPFLKTRGHEIITLRRNGAPGQNKTSWDPAAGTVSCSLDDTDAVIHLAGEPIGEGVWTRRKKNTILESRVKGTGAMARAIAACERPPEVFISASAIGYYGHRGNAIMTEEDPPGSDFISEVCSEWEKASMTATGRGVRILLPRIGVVLHPQGGALGRLLFSVRAWAGIIFGNGSQYVSWISMEDLVRSIYHIMNTRDISGPVNLAAPQPVTNRELMKSLGAAVKRPVFIRIPSPVIRLMFGQMGKEVLLSSTRVSSKKLAGSGYRFMHEDITSAFRFLLGKSMERSDKR